MRKDAGLQVASVFQTIGAQDRAPAFATLSGNNPGIQYSGTDITVFSAAGLAILIAGRVRFRGERDSWRPNDLAHLARLAADWRAHSTAVLRRLIGDFLLIVIDQDREETVAAIDRMAVRALYYAQTIEGDLVLSTRATLLATHPLVRTRVSLQSLYNYLHFHMVPSPGSIYEGVAKLEPAQFLRFRGGRVELSRYWEPEFATNVEAARLPELRAEFLEALEASVRRSLGGDAAGTFLSGGIDSSTVTGMVARVSGRPAPAYSIGFEAQGYDESHYARVAARHFGSPLRQFYVTPADIHNSLMEVAGAYDEPFGNSSAIPTLICARRAKSDGIDRLLAGDGGDELFGGNTRYAKQKIFEFYHRLPSSLRQKAIEPLLAGRGLPARIPLLSKFVSYVSQARMPMPDRTESYNFLMRRPLESLFDPSFLRAVDSLQPLELLRTRYAAAPTHSLVDRMLYLDWKFTLADNDLRKVGTTCQLAGIEVRYPWLDDEVIEFSTSLPPEWKVRGQTLRYFAKRSLKGFLPDEVIEKPKHGFGLPFGEWLKTSPQLQEQVYALLEQHKRRGFLRADFIDALIGHHRTDHAAYYGTMVWVIAMLEAWLREHGH